MADPQISNIEARLAALERALGNPRRLTQGDVVSLKEHIEVRLCAIEHATATAAAAMEKRLDGMNEFRDTLKDQAGRFTTRDEVSLQLAPIRDSLNDLRTFKDQMEGKASASSVHIAWVLSIIGLILGAIGLFK